MNKHILIDNLTASIASLAAGRDKFLSDSIDSPAYCYFLQNTRVKIPKLQEGRCELKAHTPVGILDAVFI